MSASQKNKGKRGERELARFLTERGHPSRRGVQFSGSPDSPDVLCTSLPFHIECKRCERISIYDALEQAEGDADGPALVAHRRNCKPWLAILRLDDLLALVQ
jgi:Holliday junction resolvase